MTIEQAISQISQLPIAEQLQIINSIWDNMGTDAGSSLTNAQREELDRRMTKYRDDPSTAITESELREKLKARREGV
jgi:putative addiction module component (TIGR02574 family)